MPRPRATLRSEFFDGEPDPACEPVEAGQTMPATSPAWRDLQDGIHPFGALGRNDLAPPGLVEFINRMQKQAWPHKPLTAARARIVNGHLAALKAALDDPELWAKMQLPAPWVPPHYDLDEDIPF